MAPLLNQLTWSSPSDMIFSIFSFLAQKWPILARNREKSPKIAENGCFWAKNPKYQKSGNVRPSGFPRHYLGQKIRRKYQFWKKLFKKLSFENGRFSLILARFWAKSPKTCQLRRPISRKRLNIFWFSKKFLAPHNQDYKIFQYKENLRFWLIPPPLSPLRLVWIINEKFLKFS